MSGSASVKGMVEGVLRKDAHHMSPSEKLAAIADGVASVSSRFDSLLERRDAARKADAAPETWYVQVFKDAKGTDHMKDVEVQASSKEEAIKKAKAKAPGGGHYYASVAKK